MSAINPEGSKFRWQGFDFVFVTEPNHLWKNWLCFKHPDGQWVTLHKCDSFEPIDWQSRALAAEQERDQLKATNTRLNRRVQAMESKHPERSTLWGSDNTLRLEITRLHKELVAAHKGAATYSWICWKRLDEKEQLKAELQQAREAIKKLANDWHDVTQSPVVPTVVSMTIRDCINQLRAILERIEKEKK